MREFIEEMKASQDTNFQLAGTTLEKMVSDKVCVCMCVCACACACVCVCVCVCVHANCQAHNKCEHGA